MTPELKELALRIAGTAEPRGREAALQAVRAIDPAATLRVDEATGIAHVSTRCQAIEVEDALAKAGPEVTAATG